MLLKTLVENTSISSSFQHKHGICFYIEVENHKILFDLGPNDLFIENAKKMNVDLKQIDTVIISHGHVDYAGALQSFLKINHQAKIYVRENAFEEHFNKFLGIQKNIGIEPKLKNHPQIILTQQQTIINDNMILFSNIKTKEFLPQANLSLYKKENNQFVLDDFTHEQSLIIKEGKKRILISGCSHAGIINIKNAAENLIKEKLTHVIGGFHLYNPVSHRYEKQEFINQLANQLKQQPIQYYTCHCTGQKAFDILNNHLQQQIHYLSTGSILEL